jgi:hypothetical protein
MLGDDFVLAIAYHRIIEAGVLAMNPLFFRMNKPVPNIGGVEQRFGRNAADEKARPAQSRVRLDAGYLQSILPGANRSRISTGTTPDDNHVVGHFIFSVAFGTNISS